MAGIFNELLASQYAELLRKVFGEGVDLSSVTPELGATIELDSLSHSRDWDYHLGIFEWQGRVLEPALGAGVIGGSGIRNPAGSQLLAVITQIRNALPAANSKVFLSNISTIGGNLPSNYVAVTAGVRKADGRVPTLALPLDRLEKAAGGASAIDNASCALGPGEFTAPGFYRVLLPGQYMLVEADTANLGIDVNYEGYLTQARPQELIS